MASKIEVEAPTAPAPAIDSSAPGPAQVQAPGLPFTQGLAGGIELGSLPPAKAMEEGIMQLARVGNIEMLKKMVEGGMPLADFKDGEGITPLHVGTCSDTDFYRNEYSTSGLRKLTLITVGCDQQPIRCLSILTRYRFRRECNGRRIGSNAPDVGFSERPLLYC
jgi:hypothetical protein